MKSLALQLFFGAALAASIVQPWSMTAARAESPASYHGAVVTHFQTAKVDGVRDLLP